MRAIVHENENGLDGLTVKDMSVKQVTGKEVRIQIHTAGMNRRDLAVVTKRHTAEDPPLIPGSDASGIVEAVGEQVTKFQPGDEVVVNPGLGWQRKSAAPPQGFEIVGLPDDGTFAEYYTCTEDHVERKPEYLSFEEAGVLPLAALTAYRALFTRGNLKADQTVMLPGIGSGVLTFCLKFAKAIGARVIVTSRSTEKQKEALKLGADVTLSTEEDWNNSLSSENVDLLIESIGNATFNKSLDIVRKGGTIVTFGSTTEDEVKLNIRQFFYGQYNLLGSTMGSAEEFREMLHFVTEHHIRPQLDKTFSIDEYLQAFEYIRDSKNFGKIGFKIV
ncbi:zinc-binding alcohol dehydrogenase/oxidoreductase [Halobacillus karajensis]|uniref:Alcohol dehydrogenase n=1 Tax=Halobacillus karajensis TaxID=195088 RepID=A0A024P194_9BACI|nr:zinc-binding dehydrogenase [Halobacillus karajensis]CDQ19587.1 Alcohol dehydrogenase [Halobacillus karajensis]CDQ22049.1 Alcohol dehydrogenase [Halobacillus karajensis]CDQ27890.1 Alcohol dehydrogenase [Halobacillus karajensis]SEH79860.1 zinc-binding alcohol dehydrogenase/oxidoreductase [Halobacillus karajensis]